MIITIGYVVVSGMILIGFVLSVNTLYSNASPWFEARRMFVEQIYLASPATVPAGRNIAHETSNAVANAPASYLTMLDCCESDEAISDRIAVGKTQARIIKKAKTN